jgi:predicted Zn finger-like uncharacterized protein
MFRVVADQLKLRGGLVRCGTCRHVFDAIGSLTYVDDTSVAPAPVPPPAGAPKSSSSAPRPAAKPAPAPSKVVPKRDVSQPLTQPLTRPITLRITPSSTSSVFAQSERIEPRLARVAPPQPPPTAPPPAPPPPPPRPREIRETEPLARATIPAETGVPTLWMTEDEVLAGTSAKTTVAKPVVAEATPVETAKAKPAPPPPVPAQKKRESKRRAADRPAPSAAAAPPPAKSTASIQQQAQAEDAAQSTSGEDAALAAASEAAPAFLRDSESAKGFSIVFTAGAAVLALLACIQLLAIFRTELVTRWPALRPTLVQACGWMGCSVGWPTRAELLAVVGTELQAVPGTDVLELTAVVRNRANHRVALPAIEVTLTDTQNRPVARKVFAPVDYLASSGESTTRVDEGLGAGSDLTIRLVFEARGLAAAGFVVYPFYL